MLHVLLLIFASCGEKADCVDLQARVDQLEEHAFDCAYSLSYVTEQTYAVAECLREHQESCSAAKGDILARIEGGSVLHLIFVGTECEVTIISLAAPGDPHAFSQQTCGTFIPTMTGQGFVVEECDDEVNDIACE